jgi:hypothetical protein
MRAGSSENGYHIGIALFGLPVILTLPEISESSNVNGLSNPAILFFVVISEELESYGDEGVATFL